ASAPSTTGASKSGAMSPTAGFMGMSLHQSPRHATPNATRCIPTFRAGVRHRDDLWCPMTFASKITLTRLLLVPVFAVFAIYYGNSIAAGQPVEWFRWTALAIFVTAAA